MWAPETPRRSTLVSFLLLPIFIHLVLCVPPPPVDPRQSPLSALRLPKCALQCFVDSILNDGCANEADFACHCGVGDFLHKATVCVGQGCSTAEETDTFAKVRAACSAIGGGNGGVGAGAGSGISTAAGIPSPSGGLVFTAPTSSQQGPITTSRNSRPPSSTESTTPALSTATSAPSSSSAPPTPDPSMPLALVPPSSQLSDGAKAGISVSVTVFALGIFFGLGWYIRRLKRALRTAQSTNTPSLSNAAWHASMTPIAAPTRSWSQRRRESPVSPISPEMMTVEDNGYGVLKKKRGNVLSIVIEDDEDVRSAIGSSSVREPVPGQREGLSDPLELDGKESELERFELPLSVTPMERPSTAERSRPGTAKGGTYF
ncbi:hypothetical protein FB567DRAFT_535160 [Paraphoma chrysanthemicola]|uniref:CFEM domain-containing protein n=1 Tax=Paraphoma chrysanthemicola TaxID=798071 RepID=A0A8K0QYH9_9PLEO|nr:hypothetical protein FB567DRAFT_535160 [Paraphoma chrysanthemicola]